MTFKRSPSTQSFGNKVRNIARSPQNTVGGFLSKIFFNVLEKRTRVNLDHYPDQRTFLERWNALVVHYLNDPVNSIPQNKEALSAARGNLTKEILKPSMTWKVWVKALRLMQVVKIDFHFKFTLFNKEIIDHSATMNLGHVHVEDENELNFIQIPPPVKVPNTDNGQESGKENYVRPIPASSIPEDILG